MSHAFGDIRLGAIRRRSGSELLSPWRPPPLLRTGHAEDANITFQDSGLDRTGRYITDARILTVDRCPLSAVRCPRVSTEKSQTSCSSSSAALATPLSAPKFETGTGVHCTIITLPALGATRPLQAYCCLALLARC